MQTSLPTRALLPALLLGALAVPAATQSIQTLVLQGDAVPGVGAITRIDTLAINDAGDWLVEADTDHSDTNADTVLLFNGALFLREGQAMGAPVGATLNGLDDLWLNNHGNQSHNLFLSNTGSTSNDSGVYWNDVLVLQEGTISNATAFTPGTPYIGFFGTKINDANQIAVLASVDDPNIASTVDRALVIFDVDGAGNLLAETVLVMEADVLPGQTEAVTDMSTGPHEWAFSNNGELMYVALLAGATATNNAIYIDGTLIAQKGDPSPVPGFDYSGFTTTKLDLSSNGLHHVFSASLSGPTATNALIVRNGSKLVQKGESVPAIAPFVLTTFGSGPIQIADNGDVLWYGDWDDPDTTRDKALFINEDPIVQIGVTTVGPHTVTTLRGIQDGYGLSRDGRYVIFEAVLSNGLEGAFLIDRLSAPQYLCFGDGTGSLCPCSNDGSPGQGCANSTGSGVRLISGGSNSIGAGDLRLIASQLPPFQPGLFFQGTQSVNGGLGTFNGDGLFCAGGVIVRLELGFASAGGALESTVDIPAAGGVGPGDVRYYQLWYRDSIGPCSTGSNLSSMVVVTYEP